MNNQQKYEDILLNIERQQVLFDLYLINAKQETVYDKLTALASQVIGTPISLVSMVTNKFQFFKSEFGLGEPLKTKRRTPLSHSFCQHVVQSNEPLIVSDAREHNLVKNNLAIRDLNVIGYLGIPLTLSDGLALGSFCAIDTEARIWTETEIEIMHELAAIVTKEFDTRAYVRVRKVLQEQLTDLQSRIIQFAEALDTHQPKEGILEDVRQLRVSFDLI